MVQGIIDFWDNNTVAIVLVLIGAVAAAVATLALQKAPGVVGKAARWLWGKLRFRKKATLTIEETFDKELEAWQAQLVFASSGPGKKFASGERRKPNPSCNIS